MKVICYFFCPICCNYFVYSGSEKTMDLKATRAA